MTRRLPATLKKRLQANLETLTPNEAGRLFLLYAHEALDKKKIAISDYPPVKELFNAFENRVKKTRGKPEERETIVAVQGLRFLAGLFETVNLEGPHRFLSTAFDAFRVQTSTAIILQQDAAGTVIQSLVSELLRRPQSLPPDFYDQVVAWMNGDRLFMLSEVADSELESEEMKILESESLQISDEFAARYSTDPSNVRDKEIFDAIKTAVGQERQMRQDWAEAQGEKWLRSAFDNRSDRLEQWIEFSDGYYTEADRETRQKAILADLVAKLKTGELVGGEAVDHESLRYPVLIAAAGRFPMWAALRILWRPFAESRDFRIEESATAARRYPGRADVVRDLKGRQVLRGELRELAAAFWQACRGRSWGKKLSAKPDLDAVADFLTWSPSPLLHLLAPNWGTVVFDTWERADGHDLPWVKKPAATAASLGAVLGGYDWGESELEDTRLYRGQSRYPDKPTGDDHLAHVLLMADDMIPRRQLFTYRKKEDKEDGLLPLSSLFGFELLTSLEATIANYRTVADNLASIKAALTAVGDRYFEGLPVLTKMQSGDLDRSEAYLAAAADWLKDWVERLDAYPWEVDTTDLDLDKPEADEETVERIVAGWLEDTRRRTNIKDETGLLW